ncbi:DUF2474 domain-containing protein [Cupriavidus sp. 2KB_3]
MSRTPDWIRRTGWLLFIWACSVAGLGGAAFVLRLLMQMAGIHR